MTWTVGAQPVSVPDSLNKRWVRTRWNAAPGELRPGKPNFVTTTMTTQYPRRIARWADQSSGDFPESGSGSNDGNPTVNRANWSMEIQDGFDPCGCTCTSRSSIPQARNA